MFFLRFFETFCEYAPQNKLRGSTNFITLGPTYQKLRGTKILKEVWAGQASARANQQELTTSGQKGGQ
jgi:hypothetical protein